MYAMIFFFLLIHSVATHDIYCRSVHPDMRRSSGVFLSMNSRVKGQKMFYAVSLHIVNPPKANCDLWSDDFFLIQPCVFGFEVVSLSLVFLQQISLSVSHRFKLRMTASKLARAVCFRCLTSSRNNSWFVCAPQLVPCYTCKAKNK